MPKVAVKNIVRVACALSILGITPAFALEHIRSYVPEAEQVGQGRLTYLFWDVYDATLYAPKGAWTKEKPFALQLSYLREIEGKQIADRSVVEMRDLGITDEIKLATWHSQMRRIFPNVNDGISLTGVYTGKGDTIFYLGDVQIGRIEDPEFSNAFFKIWLDENTSSPDLRKKLLGEL